ncbi:MAG TPA: outer membrane beta-barrel protein [Elusimicrobiota bacterium]|nr:outer membrane beta-barrel protein [Elusimicrobiota bacterium]
MPTRQRRLVRIAAFLSLALSTAALAPRAASADDDHPHAAQPGVTFGGRGTYFHSLGADNGTWSGGAQLRFHITSVIAIEASGDYRQSKFEGRIVDVYPVQGSLMLYLAPNWVISPYILGGEGWYTTHVRDGDTTHRYGPHAGAGLEAALNRHWTIDGSYRYLWTQSLTVPTSAHPLGKNFSDNGYMITAALNYRF